MKITFRPLLATLALTAVFTSCKKDSDPVIVIVPSSGSTMTLNGLISTESGDAAGNSVFVDFSTDIQSDVVRNSWDLGFYCGIDNKVIINSTCAATAVAVNKTDINSVSVSDVNLDTLKLGRGLGSFAVIDNPTETSILNKTVITTVSTTDADNKVYVINPKGGSGSVLPTDSIFKIRILTNSQGGYSLQYAKLSETTYKTLNITKNNSNNFNYVSLFNGAIVSVEPAKASWDIMWSVNTYIASATIPYVFSDFVTINNLAGVSAAKCTYADETTATVAYNLFNVDSAAKYTLISSRIAIGSGWRSTTGSGIYKNIFYIVKDPAGNYYKLKFLAMGVGSDGGTRGKPVIQYELISK